MAQYLIVMSVDAMFYEDLAYLKNKPYFSRLMEKGSMVERVRTIYPSLTHPVHATILTGCYSDKTGVPHNVRFSAGKKDVWYNDLRDIQVPTIFHAAKENGLTTCACRWPVTAGREDAIDYLLPEVIDEIPGESIENPYRRLGTREELLQEVILPIALQQDPEAPRHPAYDTMEIEVAAEIIRKYKPNVLFTHPGHLDSARHQNGLFNDKVNEALDLVEEHLGMLMRAAEDAGIYEETNFVVLSDHGQLETKRVICPNVLLAQAGFLQIGANNELADWDAFVQSAGLSAHVMLKNPEDEEMQKKVYAYLQELCSEGIYGISRVLTAQEAKEQYHLAGKFSFVLESDGFSAFGEDWTKPFVRPQDIGDYRYGRATHGHTPEIGPQPPLVCMGPAFKTGVCIPEGKIVDEAPTFAKAMGFTMNTTDGSAIDELLA